MKSDFEKWADSFYDDRFKSPLVFAPVITFGFAYLGGMILDWIVGDKLVNGLNLMVCMG